MPWLLFVLFLNRVIIKYSMEGDFRMFHLIGLDLLDCVTIEIYLINIQRIVAKKMFLLINWNYHGYYMFILRKYQI